MVQFFLLSVVLNIAGGYSLALANRPRSAKVIGHLDRFLCDDRVRLAFGIVSIVTGIFKFISPMRGDVRIIGDLIPAVTGLLAGAVLLLELHHGPTKPFAGPGADRSAGKAEGQVTAPGGSPARNPNRLERFLLGGGVAIGYAAMCAGVMHFFFPMELFL